MEPVSLPEALERPDRIGRLVLALMLFWLLWQVGARLLSGWPLEASCIRDDAYYQFVVARHLVDGLGYSFDGVHGASGVQVLWTWILALPAFVLGTAIIPTLSLVLGLLLHIGGGLLVHRLVKDLAGPVVALGIAGFFLSRPGLIQEAMNGQETALGLFLVLLWADVALPIGQGRPRGRAWIYPVTILLPWARSEALLLPLGSLLWTRLGPRFGGSALPWRPLFMPFVLSLLIYLLLHWILFGSPIPSSGTALPWLFHANFQQTGPDVLDWLREFWWFTRPILLGGPWNVAALRVRPDGGHVDPRSDILAKAQPSRPALSGRAAPRRPGPLRGIPGQPVSDLRVDAPPTVAHRA